MSRGNAIETPCKLSGRSPLVRESTTPDFSRYLRYSSFFASGVCVSSSKRGVPMHCPGPLALAGWALEHSTHHVAHVDSWLERGWMLDLTQ